MGDEAGPIPKNELDAAEMVRDGTLPPGFQFHNIYMWPLRVTGTGVSWRSKDKSFCFRPPEHYLNDEFLARCNGLPVIYEHPEGATLNSEEYHDRNVGSVMLPYIQGDEIWAVARIYDEATHQILSTNPMSTSPCVDFARNENKSIILDNGEKCLLEGNPPLLDHLAICEQGVWDKLGEPAGVGNGMTPEEEAAKVAADKAKKPDAEGVEGGKEATGSEEGMDGIHSKLNAIMDCIGATTAKMDSVSARMDKFEAGKKPDAEAAETKPETEAERKDRERKEKEAKPDSNTPVDAKENTAEELRRLEKLGEENAKQMKADTAKIQADADELKKRLADAEEKLKEPTEAETEAMSDRQQKADSVMIQHGRRAPPPMRGENGPAYRLRMAKEFQPFSPTWKDTNLAVIAAADAKAFENAERAIYADAETAARTPETKPGVLRMRQERSDTGHMINTFDGDISTWLHAPYRMRGKFKQNDRAA